MPLQRLNSKVDSKSMLFKNSPMPGFEPQTSGVGSDRSANLVTTTAQVTIVYKTDLAVPSRST